MPGCRRHIYRLLQIVLFSVVSLASAACLPPPECNPSDITCSPEAWLLYLLAARPITDFNGDGITDHAFGAYRADPNARASAGEAYLYLGGSTMPTVLDPSQTVPHLKLQGALANAELASNMIACDVNGDGLHDWIVSDTDGFVYVTFGSRNSVARTIDLAVENTDWVIQGPQPEEFGSALACGDVNGDGIDDLAVTCQSCDSGFTNNGILSVIAGARDAGGVTNLSGGDVPLFTLIGPSANAFLGPSAAILDYNGDGFGDVMTASVNTGTGGQVFGMYGGPTLPASLDLSALTPNYQVDSTAAGIGFGNQIAGGNLNGDGQDDLMIAASNPGDAYLYYGGTAPATELQTDADATFLNASSRRLVLRDWNLDGFDDMVLASGVVSDPGFTNQGNLYLVYTRPTAPFSGTIDFSVVSPVFYAIGADQDRFATSADIGGDLDGDRLPDLLVGAETADPAGCTDCGAALFFFSSNLNGSVNFQTGVGSANRIVRGPIDGDNLGITVLALP